MDLSELKEAARVGRLDEASRLAVLCALRRGEGPLYELIDIAGWMAMHKGPSQEEIDTVAPFLDYRTDSMIPGLALTVLVGRWRLGESYLNRVLEFLKGAQWDLEGSAKLAAATVAGELLQSRPNSHLIQELLEILQNADELSGNREAAYFALVRANGTAVADQVRKGMRFPVAAIEDDETVKWAKQQITR